MKSPFITGGIVQHVQYPDARFKIVGFQLDVTGNVYQYVLKFSPLPGETSLDKTNLLYGVKQKDISKYVKPTKKKK